MTILLFGVSNVGKTTIGEILAAKLGYQFFDLDEEVKKYYHTTLEDFIKVGSLEIRDRKRGVVINKILQNQVKKVVAISPISYSENFNHYLYRSDVLSIELRDTAENIYSRFVFSDKNDNVYKDDDYKNEYKEKYINEIKEDIAWYSRSFVNVKNKFDINNNPPEVVAERLIKSLRI